MTAEREAMTLEQVRTRLRDLVRQAPDEIDSVIVPIRELIGFAHAIDAHLSRAAEPVEHWRQHPTLPLRLSDLGGVQRSDGSAVETYRNNHGYQWVNAGVRSYGVAVLVLETFEGPRPDGHECDHVNGIRDDNRFVNLRWLPWRQNRSKHGTDNHAAKLTPENVLDIRKRIESGDAKRAIARDFGVDEKAIRLIATGETWTTI